MNQIVKHINETDIQTIVKTTLNNKRDVWDVIEKIKEANVSFLLKSQQLVDELSKHLTEYKKGMIIEALEDCMNNFRKGQQLEITAVTEDGVVLEGLAEIEEKWIRKHFKIVSVSDCL